jgi:hypothetical protein
MATVNLGSIKFKWKGTYSGATAYTIDDVVEYNGSSYICILASTGNLPTNATYFEQMSSAGTNGTNGTDLGTTLTTQGDLVYRDGSGLQRLGAGTAGQVLQTGGAGANPSWGTVSSDYVKLVSTDFSNVSSMSLDGYYSATYKNYRVIVNNFYGSSGSDVHFSFNTGGSQINNSNYTTRVGRMSAPTSIDASGADGAKYRLWYGGSANSAITSSITMDIYDPLQTSSRHTMSYRGASWDSGNNLYHFFGSVSHSTLQAHSGFTLDNFTSGYGTLTMYGIK